MLCVTVPDFLKIIFLPQKWEKWAKNGPKIAFFEFIGKFYPLIFSEFGL